MIVVDASIVVEVLRGGPSAQGILRRITEPATSLHAPHLLDAEVTQVLRRFERRGVLTTSRGLSAMRLLETFPLQRHAHQQLLPRVWELRHQLTAYDAIYLALAEALGATLVTLDTRLAKAPSARGRIEVVTP